MVGRGAPKPIRPWRPHKTLLHKAAVVETGTRHRGKQIMFTRVFLACMGCRYTIVFPAHTGRREIPLPLFPAHMGHRLNPISRPKPDGGCRLRHNIPITMVGRGTPEPIRPQRSYKTLLRKATVVEAGTFRSGKNQIRKGFPHV